jgi:formate dehydrogenase subunit delta
MASPQLDHLVRMANQIGDFYASQSPSDVATAAQGVAGHLKSFWAPPMRQELVDAADAGTAAGASEVVLEALRAHREALLVPGATVAGQRREVFPEGGGDAG